MSSHWQSLHFSPQHTRGISTWSKQYSRPWGLYRQPIKNFKKSLFLKTLHPRGQEVVKALKRNAPWRSSPGLALWQVCAEGRGGGAGLVRRRQRQKRLCPSLRDTAATYTTGIEPTSSWILVRFVTCSATRGTPTYTTAHGNAGSLTYWVRPRKKPATSWFSVGFVSAASGREFYFPTVQQGDQVIYITFFSPTLCSVATWVSRHSSQC